MPSKLVCKERRQEPTAEEKEVLFEIFDILAVRVVRELVGKKAGKNEPNWPHARIAKVVGSLCMRRNLPFKTMLHYVTLCHEQNSPVRPTAENLLPAGLGKALVKDHIRKNSGEIFTDQGRRKLHSFAKELGLSSIDLFGAIGVLIHELADELATCCGGPHANE